MVPLLPAFGHLDAIVPVPLHSRKLDLRGYNQSELLATRIAAQSKLPMKPLLIRTRATQSQVSLDQHNRRQNVKGAFALNPRWAVPEGQHFLLIDDVRTTGATTDACAKVLMEEAKADAVSVLTFAQEFPSSEMERWLEGLSALPSTR